MEISLFRLFSFPPDKIFLMTILKLFLSISILITLLSFTFFLFLRYFQTNVYEIKFNDEFSFNFEEERQPKICEKRVWEINLTRNIIEFFENCKLKDTIFISYQGPADKWYQTPTGYYRVGIKKERHISSLFPVYMNYAVQMYEDFFIHEIPFYLNGVRVNSNFSGGCIRLETDQAKKFYAMAQPGDLIISYRELAVIDLKDYFHQPVNLKEFYIRQNFNNPLKTSWRAKSNSMGLKANYLQHAGIDLAPLPNAKDLNVYNIFDGKVVKIIENGKHDHGLGNTVIIELDKKICNYKEDLCKKGKEFYVLYGHLELINPNLIRGENIKKGEIIGKVGATGYGCNYWRIGKDGCETQGKLDIHLHLEIKTKPVLESPIATKCFINGSYKNCYGYTPYNPENYGYLDPIKFLAFD